MDRDAVITVGAGALALMALAYLGKKAAEWLSELLALFSRYSGKLEMLAAGVLAGALLLLEQEDAPQALP